MEKQVHLPSSVTVQGSSVPGFGAFFTAGKNDELHLPT